jgi:hypothetical protein
MFFVPARSSGSSVTPRRHYWRTALAGTVTLAAALFAVAPAASAAVAAKPARAAIVGTARIGGRSHATNPSGPVSESRIPTFRPDITEKWCGGGNPNWVHFYVAGGSFCFGNRGTIITNFPSYELCAGNNSGYFIYTVNGHRSRPSYFTPGFYWGFPVTFTINVVHISGFSGNATCHS